VSTIMVFERIFWEVDENESCRNRVFLYMIQNGNIKNRVEYRSSLDALYARRDSGRIAQNTRWEVYYENCFAASDLPILMSIRPIYLPLKGTKLGRRCNATLIDDTLDIACSLFNAMR